MFLEPFLVQFSNFIFDLTLEVTVLDTFLPDSINNFGHLRVLECLAVELHQRFSVHFVSYEFTHFIKAGIITLDSLRRHDKLRAFVKHLIAHIRVVAQFALIVYTANHIFTLFRRLLPFPEAVAVEDMRSFVIF